MVKAQAKKKSIKATLGSKAGPTWWFLLGAMILLCICIALAMWAGRELTIKKQAERKFEEISKEYYEEYLYPNFLEENRNEEGKVNLEEAFSEYSKHGFATVRLRQLLSYNEGKNEDFRSLFTSDEYECSTDTSGVVFYPIAPYGKTDYRAEYILHCEGN